LSLTTTTGDFIPTTVSVVSGTCGANYAPYVTVTVTDALGAHDSIVIKNSAGSWVELTTLDRTFCSLPDPWYNGGSSTPYDLIVGSQRWYMHQVTGGTPACGNIVTSGWSSYGYGAACDSFDIWPPCGTPTQCAIMYGNVTCTDPSYQVPAYQQVQYYEWECR